jgi:hypothetical protein
MRHLVVTERERTSCAVVAFRCGASALVPFQLGTNVDCEVVLVQHLMLEIFVLPMHNMGPSQLPKIEVHTRCRNILAVECPRSGWEKGGYREKR